MLPRRTLVLAPLVAALAPLPALAHPRPRPAWAHDIRELRVAASGPGASALAATLARQWGVPVRPVQAQGSHLATLLDRGHVEFALLDPTTLRQARTRMQARLLDVAACNDGRTLVIREVLPPAMRADLAAALHAYAA